MTLRHLRGGVALIGTAAEFTSANPVLLERQLSLETDTGIQKIGDGASHYAALSALPGGGAGDGSLPSPSDSDARKLVQVNDSGTGFVLADSLPFGGDYVQFDRNTDTDSTSGGFNYVDNLTASQGASITVDDSAEWISAYGYPLPKLNESGLYTLGATLICQSSGPLTFGLQLRIWDGLDVNSVLPWDNLRNVSQTGTDESAFLSLTAWLPAVARLEMELLSANSADLSMVARFIVQRLA